MEIKINSKLHQNYLYENAHSSYRCRSVVHFADRAKIQYHCTGTGF